MKFPHSRFLCILLCQRGLSLKTEEVQIGAKNVANIMDHLDNNTNKGCQRKCDQSFIAGIVGPTLNVGQAV